MRVSLKENERFVCIDCCGLVGRALMAARSQKGQASKRPTDNSKTNKGTRLRVHHSDRQKVNSYGRDLAKRIRVPRSLMTNLFNLTHTTSSH